MADGSITISTALDNRELEKELHRLTKKIERIQDQIYKKQAEKMPLVEQSKQLAANLDVAKEKLAYMRSGKEFFPSATVQGQAAAIKSAEAEWSRVQEHVERIDASVQAMTAELSRQKESAGAVAQELARAGKSSDAMRKASDKAQKSMTRFSLRLREVMRSALIFTAITQSLAALREWTVKVIRTNDKATAAFARLKAAALTLAQPLVDVLIPAIIKISDLLTAIMMTAARLMANFFGTTIEQTKEAAENLYSESEALDETGKSADKAMKSLASFDEINRLSSDSDGGKKNDEIAPDFQGMGEQNWLSEMMERVTGWVPVALMLGGIALVAIGAAKGSLMLVLAGLLLLLTGYTVAAENEQLKSWITTLGLNRVEEFVAIALILGGIAMVAIGAATGNILLVIAGLLLIGMVILYSEKSGMMQDWAETLGLNKAASFITAALLIAGFALIVLGAIKKDFLMVAAGVGLIAAGIIVGSKSGTFETWWDALQLSGAAGWVTAGLLIAGMAMIVFGIMMKNFMLVLTGVGLIASGIAVGSETGTFQNWWDALGLPQVQNWITAILLVGGMALVVFGILAHNLIMIVGGFTLLNVGVAYGQGSGTFENWWDALGLPDAEKWITAAMLIAGIGLAVLGIVTANVPAFLLGLVLIGVGINFGEKSGTFASWAEALHLDDVAGKVTAAIMLAGIALIAIGAMTLNPLMILAGLGLLGAGFVANKLTGGSAGGVEAGNRSIPSIASYSVPHLATGAVIPPNREFLAVLGDQRSGTNIEAPVSEIEAAVARGVAQAGGNGARQITVVLELERKQLGRVVYDLNREEAQRVGVRLTGG